MKDNKNFAIAIVSVLILVLVAALVWPLTEQRNRSIDRTIDADLTQISSAVDEYYSAEGRLPGSVSDLDLREETRDRISKYEYSLEKETAQSYKLCAKFKTDTSETIESESDSFYSSYYEPKSHMAGIDCYEYEVFGYYDEPYRGGFEDLDFGDEPFVEAEIPGSFEYDLDELNEDELPDSIEL